MSRPGTNNQLRWVLCLELIQRDFVIAENADGGTLEGEILVDVPGEGVVVVDEDEVRGGGYQRGGLRVMRGVVYYVEGWHFVGGRWFGLGEISAKSERRQLETLLLVQNREIHRSNPGNSQAN